MKYQQGPTPDIFYQIDGDSKQSFSVNSKPMTSGYFMNLNRIEWEKTNELLPFKTPETPEEKEIREQKELEQLKENLKIERNKRIVEADKWELPTVLQRYGQGITIDNILQYKLALIEMTETHTTREQLENPDWPQKLITQDLL